MQLINALFIGLLPFFDTSTSRLIGFGMSRYVFFLPLALTLAVAFFATELLKRHRNKSFATFKAYAVLVDLDWILKLLRNLKALMARYTQGNEVIHAVILAYTSRDFMVYIKPASILLRRFATHLANLITVTNCLCNLIPTIAIVDIATSIIPMVLTYEPFSHMRPIEKKQIGFLVSFHAMGRKFKLFSTTTSTLNLSMRLAIGFADFALSFFIVIATMKRIVLSSLRCLFAFFRSACNQFVNFGFFNLKRLTTDHACFLNALIGIVARFGAKFGVAFVWSSNGFTALQTGVSIRHDIILSSQDSSSICVGRLVTKPALSVGDQPTQALSIIPFLLTGRKAVRA